MRGPGRISGDPRLRALAGLLVCLLTLTLSTATHTQARKHVHRSVVAAALAVTDSPTGHVRGDLPAITAAEPAATVLTRGSGRAVDSAGSVSAPEPRAPQVRGPPTEAAA